MTGLKWFAGGKERREQAVAIIDEVIETIGDKPDYADLKQVLHSSTERNLQTLVQPLPIS